VVVLSAFMNNTPVVAMMIPVVEAWAQKTGHPASTLLIPLAFAAQLGGMCTLIGTSTNLVHGLASMTRARTAGQRRPWSRAL